MNEESVNNTAKIIVPLNSIFSNPRLVLNPASGLSEPPKAPPSPAAEDWSKIAIIRATDSIICMIGRVEAIVLKD
ncbi:MAG: hypothetical protein ACI9GH_000157 [Candidatus Paceibacteria bacterium]|jgi:hypothetical protein